MKKMKKNILAVLCTCFVASLALGVSAIAPVASADVETYTVETVQMREGATVRVGATGEHADKSGIRFALLVSQEYYATFENPVVGVYVVPASYVEATTEMQSEATIPEEALHFYTADVATLGGDIAETTNDTYSFNAVVWGIPEDSYGTELVANGYIVEGEGEKTFAANPQTRSVAQVASVALAKGDTRDGLTDYVDGVVTEENFKLKDVTMDAYKTEVPSVIEVLPENVTPIFTSSNEEVVTVDSKGVLTFTGVKGEATITAKLGTKEATATATFSDPVILKASEEAVGSLYAIKNGVTHTFEYAPASEINLNGDYAGDAMKLAYVSSTDYRLVNPYTVEELEAMKADYTDVTVSFAFDDEPFVEGGQFFFYQVENTFMTTALDGALFEISANVNALKTWYTFTLSIDEYINTLSGDGSYCYFASIGGAMGEVDGDIYISDITFTVVEEPDEPDVPVEEDDEIKVVSFNIRYRNDENGNSIAERAPRLLSVIEPYKPDVIGFQEYTPAWEAYIEQYFYSKYEFFNMYRTTDASKEGAPILWRKDKFNCVETGYFWLSDTPTIMSPDWDNDNHNRICTYVVLENKVTLKKFAYFNTHFGFGDENQIKSIAVIKQYMAKYFDMPTFITGDFNFIPNSAPYAEMTKTYSDVNGLTVNDRRDTYHGYDPSVNHNEHIDYCFIDSSIEALNFEIIDDLVNGKFVSDHFGTFSKIKLDYSIIKEPVEPEKPTISPILLFEYTPENLSGPNNDKTGKGILWSTEDAGGDYKFHYEPANGEFAAAVQGDYNGVCARMGCWPNEMKLNSPYTAAQVAALKAQGYTHVTTYVAVHSSVGDFTEGQNYTVGSTQNGSENTFLRLAFGADGKIEHVNTWYKVSITIDEFVSCFDNAGYVRMGRLTDGTLEGTNCMRNRQFMWGEIYFEQLEVEDPDVPEVPEEPEVPVPEAPLEILTISADNMRGGSNPLLKGVEDSDGRSYDFRFDADGAVQKGVNGEYEGTVAYMALWAGNVKLHVSYTAEQIEAIKAQGYTQVTTWIAVYDWNNGGLGGTNYYVGEKLNGQNTMVGLALGENAKIESLNTWHKVTISIDDFASVLDENGYVIVAKTSDGTGNASANMNGLQIALGNIYFE